MTELPDDDASDPEIIDGDSHTVPLWINRWKTLAVALTLTVSVLTLLATLAATAWFVIDPGVLASVPGAGAGVIVVGLLAPPALIGLMLFASRILLVDDWPVAQSLGGLMLVAGLILGTTVGSQWQSVAADPVALGICIAITILLIFAGGGKLVWGIAAMPRFSAGPAGEPEPAPENQAAFADLQKTALESEQPESASGISESRD